MSLYDPFLAKLQNDTHLSETEVETQVEKHLQLNDIIMSWVDGDEKVDTVLDAVAELHGDVDEWLYQVADDVDAVYEMDNRLYQQTCGGIIVPFNYQHGL